MAAMDRDEDLSRLRDSLSYLPASRRLTTEYKLIQREPIPNILVSPLEGMHMFQWGYVIYGQKNTPFEGGVYYGEMTFTDEYPIIPPHIRMVTPNARFPVNQNICLSVSAFHPENWNPSWTVESFLKSVAAYMHDIKGTPIFGFGISKVAWQRKIRQMARESISYNRKNNRFMRTFGEAALRRRYEEEPTEAAPQNLNVAFTELDALFRMAKAQAEEQKKKAQAEKEKKKVAGVEDDDDDDVESELSGYTEEDRKADEEEELWSLRVVGKL